MHYLGVGFCRLGNASALETSFKVCSVLSQESKHTDDRLYCSRVLDDRLHSCVQFSPRYSQGSVGWWVNPKTSLQLKHGLDDNVE